MDFLYKISGENVNWKRIFFVGCFAWCLVITSCIGMEITAQVSEESYQFLANDFFCTFAEMGVAIQPGEMFDFLKARIKGAEQALVEMKTGTFGPQTTIEDKCLGVDKQEEVVKMLESRDVQYRDLPFRTVLNLFFAQYAWQLLSYRIDKTQGKPSALLGYKIPLFMMALMIEKLEQEERECEETHTPLHPFGRMVRTKALIEESKNFAITLLRRIYR